jgi:hypothetical protein
MLHEHSDHNVTIVLHHAVPSESLPSFLRAALPDGLIIRRAEIWTASGASVYVEADGVPGAITAVMYVEPDITGCTLRAELAVDVPLPIVGGSIEKAIIRNVVRLMAVEYQFTLNWLHSLSDA